MPYLPNYIFSYQYILKPYKLFLYCLHDKYTKQMEDHITYYTLYIHGDTTQQEPTQRERVFSTKSPSAKNMIGAKPPRFCIYMLVPG